MIGLLRDDPRDGAYKKALADKRKTYEQSLRRAEDSAADAFPDNSTLCQKCLTKAVVLMDNCLTCLNCGDSKCG